MLTVDDTATKDPNDFIATVEDVLQLIARSTPESLHLEYKLKVDATTPSLSRDDARMVAEAVSAFANSDGGTLIMGMRSERREGEDVAAAIVEIAEVTRLAAEARNVVALNVSPQVRGVNVRMVTTGDHGAGVLIVEVPPSDGRPHMSTAPKVHRYYRRGFTGNEIMTPSQIRDQILAVREAVLTPIVQPAGGGSLSKYPASVAIEASIHVKLRNDGSRLCRDPFIRVAVDCILGSHSLIFDSRLGAWKTDYVAGMMIHVGDESPTISLRYFARLDTEILWRPKDLTVERLLAAVTIFPYADRHSENSFMGKGVSAIALEVTYGAENASARTDRFVLSSDTLARGILKGLSSALSDMFLHETGCWRDDVFSAL